MSTDGDKRLRDATVQDIQLELIRRRQFNKFDGRRIAASLDKHRDLWLAAYMDRFGVYRDEHADWIPAFSLIKLRDLPRNQWNVDSLVVLSETPEHSHELAQIAQPEEWLADEVIVQENEEEVEMALGMAPSDFGVLTAWWD